MLELKHIQKYYNPGTVNEMCLFEDFNLTIQEGQFVIRSWQQWIRKNVHVKFDLRKYRSR